MKVISDDYLISYKADNGLPTQVPVIDIALYIYLLYIMLQGIAICIIFYIKGFS